MDNRKQALTDLLVKIEAGEWFPGLCQQAFGGGESYGYAYDAYKGSLDAAKALHEAVLPDWFYIDLLCRGKRYTAHISVDVFCYTETGVSDNPARAWLIAIIKALIAEEDA